MEGQPPNAAAQACMDLTGGLDDPSYFRLVRYRCILMRSTEAHLQPGTPVISIPTEEENRICDANSPGALVDVVFCIPHTRLVRAGSVADSNLALSDPQIGGGEVEVCALECVFLDGPLEIFISL